MTPPISHYLSASLTEERIWETKRQGKRENWRLPSFLPVSSARQNRGGQECPLAWICMTSGQEISILYQLSSFQQSEAFLIRKGKSSLVAVQYEYVSSLSLKCGGDRLTVFLWRVMLKLYCIRCELSIPYSDHKVTITLKWLGNSFIDETIWWRQSTVPRWHSHCSRISLRVRLAAHYAERHGGLSVSVQ